MYLKWILVLVLINNLRACRGVRDDEDRRSSWITRMRAIRRDVKDCVKVTSNTTWSCLKISSLKLLDELTSSKVIRMWGGIQLVQVVAAEDTDAASSNNYDGKRRRDVNGFAYVMQVARRIARLLRTHALQVSLKEVAGAVLDDKGGTGEEYGTPRHRRHRNNMMIAMVFGVTALGAVLVPMGFQFLSVVSGKALLLAKMALLLASINGLKKIANSGVHYGLYQVPGEPLGYGYYDRGDAHHPRSLSSITEQPLALGVKE